MRLNRLIWSKWSGLAINLAVVYQSKAGQNCGSWCCWLTWYEVVHWFLVQPSWTSDSLWCMDFLCAAVLTCASAYLGSVWWSMIFLFESLRLLVIGVGTKIGSSAISDSNRSLSTLVSNALINALLFMDFIFNRGFNGYWLNRII